MNKASHKCIVCSKQYPLSQGILLKDASPETIDAIKQDYPDLDDTAFVCVRDIMHYKMKIIEDALSSDSKQIEQTNERILDSIKDGSFITEQLTEEMHEPLTFGQRVADKIAKFGGSWHFIFIFAGFIIIWMALNTFMLLHPEAFDPYPFILLNLMLSCLAALQAPVIMMSQNRQEARDRQQSINDYHVNLKSEIEIRLLHEKLDFFLTKQLKHLQDVQTFQISLLEDLHEHVENLTAIVQKQHKKLPEESPHRDI